MDVHDDAALEKVAHHFVRMFGNHAYTKDEAIQIMVQTMREVFDSAALASNPAKVAGYTDQPPKRVELVNQSKMIEEQLLRLLDDLQKPHLWEGKDGRYYTDPSELTLAPANPRWLAIARTHFEEGFSALTRAVLQPKRIRLPEDEAGRQGE